MLKPKNGLYCLAMLLLAVGMTLSPQHSQGAQRNKTSSSVPTLSSISPTSVTAGGASFTLTAVGTNFVSGALVLWNGAALTTTYDSSTKLTALVPNTYIAASGTCQIAVYVAGRSGGTSNQLTFSIGASVGTGGTSSPLAITTLAIPSGTQGTAYSASLAATGGTSPYSWTAGSGMPAGITLSSSGALSGTPTSSGSYSFPVTVKDSAANTASYTYSVSIGASTTPAPLAISTTSVPGGSTGTAYSASLAASGGTSPYSWSVSSGSLPSGITLSSAGALSGTPSAAGSFSFTALVKDSASGSASQTYALSVTTTVSPLAISTTSLPSGTAGSAYSATLVATGGTTPYSWSISSGALPAGVTLASSTGALSGTPSASGSDSFTAQVKDASSNVTSATYSVSIGAAINPLAISTTSIPGGTAGTAYTATTLAATGGTSPYSWSVSAGALPAGITLGSTGALGGTPTTAGSYTFTAEVKDSASGSATKSYSVSIAASVVPVAISTTSIPGGTAGTAYTTTTLAATGGTSPYSWSVSSGTIPPGLTLASTGSISGTPTTSGSYTFAVLAKDSASGSATQSYTASIAAGSTPLAIATKAVPPGIQSLGYTAALNAAGGTPPYTWTLASGSLPGGVTLTSTGALSGTPSAHGTFSFTAAAKDATGATSSVAYTLPVEATPITLPNGSGFEYGFTGYWSQINTTTDVTINTNPAYVHSGAASMQIHYHICGIPFAPTLSYAAGGALPQTTYYVVVAGRGTNGADTLPSSAVSLTVPAGNLLVVNLPPAQPDLTGADVFVGTASGGEQLQNASPLLQASTWAEPTTGLVAGVAPPTTFGAACGAASQDADRWIAQQPGNWDGYPTGANPIYVRGFFYFKHPEADGTVDNIQRKIFYLQDVPSPSHWSVVLDTFSANGAMPLAVAYLQGGNGAQQLPYLGTSLNYDTWYELEFGVIANTPGMSDGSLTLWVNGVQVWQQTGINMRGSNTTGISWIMTGQQANRLSYTPVDEYRYVDDVVIDNKFIP